MGRIIQQNNGKTTVYITGENINNIPASPNTYYVGVDTDGYYKLLNPSGGVDDFTSGGSFTGGTITGNTVFTNGLSATTFSATTYLNLPQAGVVDVSYSGLTDLITTSGLSNGSYYLITDFQTCYDQPDFDYNNSPIINTGITGNYKQGPVEPLMVLATSINTISNQAYQSMYPNDKITYDWSYSTTEVTGGVAYGRITERVDEFNNRTDYDHRTILFKRYRLYTYRQDQPLNGTIEITSTNLNNVTGTTTQFTNLSVGDVIYVPGINPSYFEVVHISGDTLMSITGDTLSTFGGGFEFYKTIEETNDSSGYLKFGMYYNDLDINGVSFSTNTWYNYVFTYLHSFPYTKKIYRNGQQLPTTISGQAQFAGIGTFRVGALWSSYSSSHYANGLISQVLVYGKVLTEAEIRQNYNATKKRYGL
jgi:hypothetical protein